VFFETAMQHKLLERLALESGMHQALRSRQFRVFYQPIVCRKAGGMVGVEALARWPRPGDGGWVSPQVFIPIAEENSLIVALGEWVLRCACQQFARWREAGLALSYVSVNVSVRQLREADFTTRLLDIVREFGMQPAQLRIEITEGVLAKGGEVEHNLTSMAAQGVCLALDDFGTGYSSLSYLRSYPIHTVKIDRSFVQCLPDDPAACRLTESIVMMCAALGKEVVAEGVESEAQQRFLERVGCEVVQGYLFGRPMEAADIPGFARRLQGAAAPQTAPQAAPQVAPPAAAAG
jgi:EAL domain-containing protein (putative c-di-GMP-specific phosphodiesterase class I)